MALSNAQQQALSIATVRHFSGDRLASCDARTATIAALLRKGCIKVASRHEARHTTRGAFGRGNHSTRVEVWFQYDITKKGARALVDAIGKQAFVALCKQGKAAA